MSKEEDTTNFGKETKTSKTRGRLSWDLKDVEREDHQRRRNEKDSGDISTSKRDPSPSSWFFLPFLKPTCF